jgi:hypothetical protein
MFVFFFFSSSSGQALGQMACYGLTFIPISSPIAFLADNVKICFAFFLYESCWSRDS